MAREKLTDEAVAEGIRGTAWARDGDEIARTYTFADFRASMAFVNRVADLAEQRNHHPDIAVSWNKVTLRLTTHDSGGLTDLDLGLARDADAAAAP